MGKRQVAIVCKVHRSQDVAFFSKWQMSVTNTTQGNAAYEANTNLNLCVVHDMEQGDHLLHLLYHLLSYCKCRGNPLEVISELCCDLSSSYLWWIGTHGKWWLWGNDCADDDCWWTVGRRLSRGKLDADTRTTRKFSPLFRLCFRRLCCWFRQRLLRSLLLGWEDVCPCMTCATLYTGLIKMAFNPYPTAFLYGNGMVLHFYQQQGSSTTKTVHKVINKGFKTYV